ncbi:MAG: D-alanine--D-alanine ligase [Nitrospirae bacterium]|nr:D-alanine--D-alanine ligase [Nitrospirota bacterium]
MRKELKDKKIAVLMGGTSSERDVSIKSGTAVLAALSEAGYNAHALDAGRDIAYRLLAFKPDIVFIALHGGWGENGSIQGLLEILEIPYSGSSVLASAMAMDKHASKTLFLNHGLNTAPYIVIEKTVGMENGVISSNMEEPDFPLPWIVKPNAEGSSIGIGIVRTREDYIAAVTQALSFGSKAIVERFINGREIQVGILGGQVLGCVEVRPSSEFYDYTAKYTVGCTQYILPPDIEEYVSDMIKDAALEAFRALCCRGYGRVDTILSEGCDIIEEGGGANSCEQAAVYLLEVNTLPGMTSTSLLPKIARHAGISFLTLIEEILISALNTYPFMSSDMDSDNKGVLVDIENIPFHIGEGLGEGTP